LQQWADEVKKTGELIDEKTLRWMELSELGS
jgi:hypothetical protein